MDPIFHVICGSHLYGLQTPTSDVDHGEVFAETREQLFGIDGEKTLSQIVTDEKDENRHFLRHFARLCAKGNPNVIEWLWVPESRIIYASSEFRWHVLEKRHRYFGLVSLRNSHRGLALSQIEKMRNSNGKAGKNRRDLIARHGYDVKFASHAIRLFHQLRHIVTYGEIAYPIPEPYRGEIMMVKTGCVPHSQIDGLIVRATDQADEAVAINRAKIPDVADIGGINADLISLFGAIL